MMTEDADEPIELTQVDAIEQYITATVSSADHPVPLKRFQQSYTLLKQLGAGAMGEVHLATENYLQRKVAFKQLKQNITVNHQVVKRFLNEVQITAQLDHPNIVPIYSLEKTADGVAYAMKVVRGKTLKELIQETRQQYAQYHKPDEGNSLSHRLEYFLNVCDALYYAHSKGVIHRDLKPANIMLGAYNEVYVMDWGISRLIGSCHDQVGSGPEGEGVELLNPFQSEAEDPEDLTQVGQILGTPRYMSPEQVKGHNNTLDGRSDQFALGLILFELLTLKQAFKGKTQMDILKKVLQSQKEPLIHHIPHLKVPPELEAIIHKATAQKRDERYQTVQDMAEDIRRYLRGEAVSAKQDTFWQKWLRWLGHHQRAALGTVMAILLVSALVTLWSLFHSQMDLRAAHEREHKLNHFLKKVFEQSNHIDHHFLQTEVALEGLASVVTSHLQHGESGHDPYYLHAKNFTPPDLADSKQYNGPISVDWPISVIGYQVREADVVEKLQQLAPLRHYLKRMIIQNYTDTRPIPDPKQQRYLIAEKGLPITFGAIVLKEGVVVWLPGSDFKAPTYDPLQRPFYKLSAYKRGIHWGNPYIDVSGAGLMLTCGTALYDNSEHFLGTVSLDIKFDFIIETLLSMKHQGLKSSYLLDDQGRVVIQSSQKGQHFKATIHPDLKLPVFDNPAVVAAIRAKKSGSDEFQISASSQLISYQRLSSLGWYYVVVADLNLLLKE